MSRPTQVKSGLTRRSLFAHMGVLGGTLALGRCGLGADQKSDNRVIDTHVHVVSSGLPGLKPKPAEVERLYAGPVADMARRLKMEMDQGQVGFAFGMGSVDGEGKSVDPLGVDRTLELSRLVPGLKAIGIADPRKTSPARLKAVESQIVAHHGEIVALKAYLGYLPFGPDHPNYAPFYKLAAKYNLPVILHTGDNWSTKAKLKYAHPLTVDEVAVDHPDVQFVMAHFGNPWLIDAAEVIFKNTNVWADLSGLYVGDDAEIQRLLDATKLPDSAAGLVISDLRRAIEYVGDYRRFLYGSDWPLAPMASYRRLIERIIPKAHHAAVFRTNALNLFRLSH